MPPLNYQWYNRESTLDAKSFHSYMRKLIQMYEAADKAQSGIL